MAFFDQCLGNRKTKQTTVAEIRSGKIRIGDPTLENHHKPAHAYVERGVRRHTIGERPPQRLPDEYSQQALESQALLMQTRDGPRRIEFRRLESTDIAHHLVRDQLLRSQQLRESPPRQRARTVGAFTEDLGSDRREDQPASQDITAVRKREHKSSIIRRRLFSHSKQSNMRSDFVHIKNLNEGAEGTVALVCYTKTKELFAVKSVKKPEMILGKIPREAHVLQQITKNREQHPNIIHFVFWAYNSRLVIPFAEYYLPYFPLGDLAELMFRYVDQREPLPEMFIFKVYLQLISALKYLHQGFFEDKQVVNSTPKRLRLRGVLHRDIKPENILVRANPIRGNLPQDLEPFPDVVLSDFGHSIFDQSDNTPHGTSIWNPPELPRSSPKSDIWSAGATIHFLIHGKPPIRALPYNIPKTPANKAIWEAKPGARRAETSWPAYYTRHLRSAVNGVLRHEDHRPEAALLYDMVDEWAARAMRDYKRVSDWGLKAWALPKAPEVEVESS